MSELKTENNVVQERQLTETENRLLHFLTGRVAHQELVRMAWDYKEFQTDRLSTCIKMSRSTSWAETWLPYLLSEKDRKNPVGVWAEALKKYCEKFSPELYTYLRKKLEGSMVVNLGSGDEAAVSKKILEFNPDMVVNVDNENRDKVKEFKPKWLTVGDDALNFTSQLPDDSCSFILSGFDSIIMPNEDYQKALFQEIIRSTKTGGVIFGNKSRALELLDQNESGFKKVEFKGVNTSDDMGIKIFEKE